MRGRREWPLDFSKKQSGRWVFRSRKRAAGSRWDHLAENIVLGLGGITMRRKRFTDLAVAWCLLLFAGPMFAHTTRRRCTTASIRLTRPIFCTKPSERVHITAWGCETGFWEEGWALGLRRRGPIAQCRVRPRRQVKATLPRAWAFHNKAPRNQRARFPWGSIIALPLEANVLPDTFLSASVPRR